MRLPDSWVSCPRFLREWTAVSLECNGLAFGGSAAFTFVGALRADADILRP